MSCNFIRYKKAFLITAVFLIFTVIASAQNGQSAKLKFMAESSSAIKFRITDKGKKEIKSLRIKNSGDKDINDLKILLNNTPDLSDADGIFTLLDINNKPPREKTVALFNLFSEYTDYSGELKNLPSGENDPVKLLNVYGKSNSLDLTAGFTSLCKKAGLRFNIWDLKGFAVSEILFDNKWHFFDVSDDVFYLDKTNNIPDIRTIYTTATSDTLLRKNGIKTNKNKEDFTKAKFIRNNITTNFLSSRTENNHICNFVLLKNDSLQIVKENDAGKEKTYGIYTFEPDFSSDKYAGKFYKLENIIPTESAKDKKFPLSIKKGSVNGFFDLKIESSYPIYEAHFEINSKISNSGEVKISYSEDGSLWTNLQTINEKNTGTTKTALFSSVEGKPEKPKYLYYIRVEMMQDKDSEALITGMQAVNFFKYNTKLLPLLKEGENTLQLKFSDKFALNNKLDIELEY